MQGIVLVIPEKGDVERDNVATQWSNSGGEVVRLGKFWDPPENLKSRPVRVYGNETFCQVLAQKLNLKLISPDDELLCKIPVEFLNRSVKVLELSDFASDTFPTFVKSVILKLIPSRIYSDIDDFTKQTNQLTTEKFLQADRIQIVGEARAFILDNQVLDISLYEGAADLKSAREFLLKLLKNEVRSLLPRTCVIDLAFTKLSEWCVLEFNASWGAGLNGCDPSKVLPAIAAATISPTRA